MNLPCILLTAAMVFAFSPTVLAVEPGAETPFQTYYLDAAGRGHGAVVVNAGSGDYTNDFTRLETPHHAYVRFPADAIRPYVVFTADAAFNTIVVRYSLPYVPQEDHDTEYTLNLYVDNVLQPVPLTLSLKYIHADPTDHKFLPAVETPLENVRRWWAEARLKLDRTFGAGIRVRLQKDAVNTAVEYYLDVADLELAPVPIGKPEEAVDITAFEEPPVATPGDGCTGECIQQNTAALNRALDEAMSRVGKTVWIPPGIFKVNPTFELDESVSEVTIAGAGMWHSTLYNVETTFPTHLFRVSGNKIIVRDLQLDFAANSRRDESGNSGSHHFVGNGGNALTLERIWFRHGSTPAWYDGNEGEFAYNRVRETYADSFHLQGTASNNLIHNNHSRGIGDDGIVQWSPPGLQGSNSIFRFNTVEAPYYGRGIAFFGGENVTVEHNLVTGGNITWGLLLLPKVKDQDTSPIVEFEFINNRMEYAGTNSLASIRAEADGESVDVNMENNVFVKPPSRGIIISGSGTIMANVRGNRIGRPATGEDCIVVTANDDNIVLDDNTCLPEG